MAKKLTLEEFIDKAKKIHSNKYDYGAVVYTNTRTKVKIFCKKCKRYFYQKPNGHLTGKGCFYCANNFKKTTALFIKNAKKVHKNSYDYNKAEYFNNRTKIRIICNKCKREFLQSPLSHLCGRGCPYCFGTTRYSPQEFIAKCKKIHGENYNYEHVEYQGQQQKILLHCNNCYHDFWQSAEKHMRGQGCPYCKNSKGEKAIQNWLINHNITFIYQKRFKDCKDKRYLPFDFYLPDYNICIEFQGEQHYNPHFFKNLYKSESVGLLYFEKQKKHDKIKKDYCKKRGIKLIEIVYNINIEKQLSKWFK